MPAFATDVLRAVFLSIFALSLTACDRGDAEDEPAEWPAFFALPELVEASDIIVVAQLGEERTHTIEAPTVEGDAGRSTVVEVVRTFVVEESLKGDLLPGDLFNVFNTASIATDPGGGGDPSEAVFQVLRIEEEQSYLLFLSLIPIPEYYPEELGEFGWAAPGEPHTARVMEDGTLTWETTGRYNDAREERDIPAGEQGAGPAFDVSIEVIAGLADETSPGPTESPSPVSSTP